MTGDHHDTAFVDSGRFARSVRCWQLRRCAVCRLQPFQVWLLERGAWVLLAVTDSEAAARVKLGKAPR